MLLISVICIIAFWFLCGFLHYSLAVYNFQDEIRNREVLKRDIILVALAVGPIGLIYAIYTIMIDDSCKFRFKL